MSAEWPFLGGWVRFDMSGGVLLEGVWWLLSSGPLIWRQLRGPHSSVIQMSELCILPSLFAPCFRFLGHALVSTGLVSDLLSKVSASLGLIQYSSLKLLHQNSTQLNVGLHNLRDLMLEPNVLFHKDQQLTFKALVEKVVMPTCTNPDNI